MTRQSSHAASDNAAASTEIAGVDPIAEYVHRLVQSAPPLTPEQRDRLAVLLGGTRVAS
jgi:hypothetical protein